MCRNGKSFYEKIRKILIKLSFYSGLYMAQTASLLYAMN